MAEKRCPLPLNGIGIREFRAPAVLGIRAIRTSFDKRRNRLQTLTLINALFFLCYYRSIIFISIGPLPTCLPKVSTTIHTVLTLPNCTSSLMPFTPSTSTFTLFPAPSFSPTDLHYQAPRYPSAPYLDPLLLPLPFDSSPRQDHAPIQPSPTYLAMAFLDWIFLLPCLSHRSKSQSKPTPSTHPEPRAIAKRPRPDSPLQDLRPSRPLRSSGPVQYSNYAPPSELSSAPVGYHGSDDDPGVPYSAAQPFYELDEVDDPSRNTWRTVKAAVNPKPVS
jgi:hypothetical protein